MTRTRRLILPAATAFVLTAAAALSFARGEEASPIAIVSAWARATPPGATTGAVYLTIENRGPTDDTLTGVSTPVASMAMLHATVEENGVSTMRMMDNPVVPAGGSLEMSPGGAHVMLMHLTAPLVEGGALPLTLTFATAGTIEVEAAIGGMGAAGPP
jgi:copper(I)-binding protein